MGASTHSRVGPAQITGLPGSQSELIDGVGHILMVQRPTDINKQILQFLAA